MTFFLLLRESGLDWGKAKDIFYHLTDLQIAWLNGASIIEAKRREQEEERKRKQSSKFGQKEGSVETKSFDLRR